MIRLTLQAYTIKNIITKLGIFDCFKKHNEMQKQLSIMDEVLVNNFFFNEF